MYCSWLPFLRNINSGLVCSLMEKASEILEGYGITISESELIAMIEAAVNEFNNAFKKNAGQGNHLPGSAVTGPAAEDPDPAPVPTAEEIIADLKDVD